MEQWIIIIRLHPKATLEGLHAFLEAFYEEVHKKGSPLANIDVEYVDPIGEIIMYDPESKWNLKEAYAKVCELAEGPLNGSGIYARRGRFLNHTE